MAFVDPRGLAKESMPAGIKEVDPATITMPFSSPYTTNDINELANEMHRGRPNVTLLVRTINDGSRNSNPIGTAFDPGHAFIRIDDGGGNVQTKGFWAVGLGYALAATKADVKGEVRDDSARDWTVALSYQISPDQVDTINKYIEDFGSVYNIQDKNCLDFAIGAFDSIDMALPIEKHDWQGVYGFYGHSPSDAVMDIRESGWRYIQYGE